MTKALTPPLKWHGGKGAFNGKLAAWIISKMPKHTHYVEPYFGGGSVLLAKDPEGVSEAVNDINAELMNFWCALQDGEAFAAFQRRVEAVPFSEAEWSGAGKEPEPCWDRKGGMVGHAVNFFIRCRMSLAGRMKNFAPLSRTRTRSGMNEQASAWLNAVAGLPAVHARLKRVAILGPRPALEVIAQQDGEQTLFYCDPPYLHATRATTADYAHEMTETQHFDLLKRLAHIKGKFLLSGYHSPMYDGDAARFGWTCHEFEIVNNAAGGDTKRTMTECLWCNF
jgi:DNA adenine methylase